jgi:hypothetical protein
MEIPKEMHKRRHVFIEPPIFVVELLNHFALLLPNIVQGDGSWKTGVGRLKLEVRTPEPEDLICLSKWKKSIPLAPSSKGELDFSSIYENTLFTDFHIP